MTIINKLEMKEIKKKVSLKDSLSYFLGVIEVIRRKQSLIFRFSNYIM